MNRTLVALAVMCATGCGGVATTAPKLGGEMSVDQLLDAWNTRAGEVRAWHGKEVVVTGQLGMVDRAAAGHYIVELLSESSPERRVTVTVDEPNRYPVPTNRFAPVRVRGRLAIGVSSVMVERASIALR